MNRADPLRIADYLQHTIEAIDNIQGYTAGADLAGFMADCKTQYAVIRNLKLIGEACNNVTGSHLGFAAQHATVPWGFAYEMRNASLHGYLKVDLKIVWQTIQNNLPGLKLQILTPCQVFCYFLCSCPRIIHLG